MKKYIKPAISLLLVVVLIASLSVTAFADDLFDDYVFRGLLSFYTISLGSNNGFVKAAQRFLTCYTSSAREAIQLSGGIDGNFGNTTKEVVMDFQSHNGLTSDGIVGPNTWAKIWENVFVSPDQPGSASGVIKSNLNVTYYYENILTYRIITEGYCHFGNCNINGGNDGLFFYSYKYA